MKELTRERAIQLHRRLWRWIALKTLKEKRIVSKDEFPMFKDNTHNAECLCYCCEYAKQQEEGAIHYSPTRCVYCPIDWGTDGTDFVHCTNSIFGGWERVGNYRIAAELAFQIAALPEREDNKEAQE
ncbi:MAG: hypothetical protein ACI4DP_00070 [Candidatus Ornithomonoglobus sp.]